MKYIHILDFSYNNYNIIALRCNGQRELSNVFNMQKTIIQNC